MSEYLRVLDEDTGHVSSVPASAAAHGNYKVLDEPAVDPLTGDVLPPVFAEKKPPKAARESLSSPSTSGQKAEPEKEQVNG